MGNIVASREDQVARNNPLVFSLKSAQRPRDSKLVLMADNSKELDVFLDILENFSPKSLSSLSRVGLTPISFGFQTSFEILFLSIHLTQLLVSSTVKIQTFYRKTKQRRKQKKLFQSAQKIQACYRQHRFPFSFPFIYIYIWKSSSRPAHQLIP